MKFTDERTEVMKSMIKARGEFEPLIRTGEAKIKLNAGGSYEFQYAELPVIVNMTSPILFKNGMMVMQEAVTSKDTVSVVTFILHISGQYYESPAFCLPYVRADNQDLIKTIGGLVTYCRRYSFLAIFGLAGSSDEDIKNLKGKAKVLDSEMKPPAAMKEAENQEAETPAEESSEEDTEPEPDLKPPTGNLFADLPPQEDDSKAEMQKRRDSTIKAISKVLGNKYFDAETKAALKEKIKNTPTLEGLAGILDRAAAIAKIADMMDNDLFEDDDKSMMKENMAKAVSLSDFAVMEAQVIQVTAIRKKEKAKKEKK